MKKIFCILTLFFSILISLAGQAIYEIEGKVTSSTTKEPLAYALVFNKSIKKGTISNSEGYFRISVNKVSDSIIISYLGYKDLNIALKSKQHFYTISLEENQFLLKEIVVTPDDNSFLYKLLSDCKNVKTGRERTAKAYYELKTYVENEQVELVEGYYNILINRYQPKELNIKAGRVALRLYRNRFFTSMDGSFALLKLDLFEDKGFFPENPLNFSRQTLKKLYFLELSKKFVDKSNDSIYVIDFAPKKNNANYFGGKIWLNKTKKNILKISMTCENARKFPFLPLFSIDSIANVDFNISITYSQTGNESLFNNMDFEYKINYMSRKGKKEAYNYTVKTKTVLYVYDFQNAFLQPLFNFGISNIGDYRKINAMPYNEFFWKYNDEYRLNDSLNTNELFFEDSLSLTNKRLFKSNSYFEKGIFEHPFVSWSKNGIKFKEVLDTLQKPEDQALISEKYNLSVKIFVDINTYNDSTNIITSTIFDPFESYYRLPINNQSLCFINMYFDLCEIQRKKLVESLNKEKKIEENIILIYSDFLNIFESEKQTFLKKVKRGTDEDEMKNYNAFIIENLGIDNLKIFNIFQPTQNIDQ